LDQGLTLEIVAVDEMAQVAVAQLRAGNLTILFADSTGVAEQESALVSEADLASTVLVVPHTVTPKFLDAVQSQYAVLFAGASSREQPSRDLLAALASTTLLQTAERGTVEMITDGRTLAIKTKR
jgi:beta-lactamase superfamily II metal-dependent hydrolase